MTRAEIDDVMADVRKLSLLSLLAFLTLLQGMRKASEEDREMLKSIFRRLGEK